MILRFTGIILLLLVSLPCTAQKIKVAASIYPLSILAADLATEDFEITTVLPPAADPHHYAMKISDMKTLVAADLILWVGPGLEGFLNKAIAKNSKASLVLSELDQLFWPSTQADSLVDNNDKHAQHHHAHADEMHGGEDEAEHHHSLASRDYHIWLNPHNLQVMASAISARLIALKPQQKSLLEAKLSEVKAAIAQQDQQLRSLLGPLKNKTFAVNHPAYDHFVQYYQLQQEAAVSPSEESRLSLGKLAEIKQGLGSSRCLLVETESSRVAKLGQTLALQLVVADPLGRDFKGASIDDFMAYIGGQFEACLSL